MKTEKNLILVNKSEIEKIVPSTLLNSQKWFTALPEEEQTSVRKETFALSQVMVQAGVCRLAMGEHLENIQHILEPRNLFTRFLNTMRFSKKTAYRYMTGYNNAKERLPENVMKAAMARGFNIIGDTATKPLGVYTEAVKQLPPPKEADLTQANTWLDQIEQVRKTTKNIQQRGEVVLVEVDSEELLKECYRFVATRYKRLSGSPKQKSTWMKNFVGILLTDFQISNINFTPVNVPEDFKVARGRPREAAA